MRCFFRRIHIEVYCRRTIFTRITTHALRTIQYGNCQSQIERCKYLTNNEKLSWKRSDFLLLHELVHVAGPESLSAAGGPIPPNPTRPCPPPPYRLPSTDTSWKSHTVEAQTSVSRVHRVASVSTQLRPCLGPLGAEQALSCFKA